MTKSTLRKQPTRTLSRICFDLGIRTCRDFTRQDLIDAIEERLGEDKVAWTLLDQYGD